MSARTFDIFGTKKAFGNVHVEKLTDLKNHRLTNVLLHGNLVASINHSTGWVMLSNCGWATPTTHTAINNALRQINAPLSVHMIKGVTMVRFNDQQTSKPLVNGEKFSF